MIELAVLVVAVVPAFWVGRRSAGRRSGRGGGPVPRFDLDALPQQWYRLVNSGGVPATGVRVGFGEGYDRSLTRRLPEVTDLGPGESVTFLMLGTWATPRPAELRVSCAELSKPAVVTVPEGAEPLAS
ncbi:hypothetical protein GCM10027445_16190 [Amycolatopsis endophytica]|uniref:Uncharacterized protein n=1 Tax=Amycolatopsis endophytica TaxID=860233 RepID=A0A853B5X0_9PSEU|nr:hypothetical protein [Amycolatopsis endophytica]NYI90167.1 hypothetical protein [Amycolatopsis endophytica]